MTDYAPDDVLPALLVAIDARWETRQRTLPSVVYHYTSVEALKGIIKSDRMRATITSELNDTTELTHAVEILKRTLARHAAAATLPEYKALYPPQLQTFDYLRPKMAKAFVASFSGSEDDLPQWCMYADGSRGVALGFDSAILQALDVAQNLTQNVGFLGLSYSDEEQSEFFEWLVSRWERDAAAALGSGLVRASNPFLYMAHWFGILATCALALFPRMKNQCFRSEDEWRITHLHIRGLEECEVHSGHPFKTHVELNLGQIHGRLPLRSVWLGPAIATPASLASIRAFLERHGRADVAVEPSRLPIRVERHTIAL